jgi:pyruvate/2-oxoglutarate dehydrogenase complex dihydrolipoamide acyltransferase (E2) component
VNEVPIVVPDELWRQDEECVVVWLFDDGDRVSAGTLVCELAVAKVEVEVLSPATGLLRILVPEETPVRKGAVIALVDVRDATDRADR